MKIVKCPRCRLNVVPRTDGSCPGCADKLCEPEPEAPESRDESLTIAQRQGVESAAQTSAPEPPQLELCMLCHQHVHLFADGTCPACRHVADSQRAIEHVLQWKTEEGPPTEPDWDLIDRNEKRRRQSAWLSFFSAAVIATFVLALFVLALMFAIGVGQTSQNSENGRSAKLPIAVFVILVLGPLLYVVSKLVNEGRRAMQRDARLVLRDDPRPPVVYLRSFIHDASRQNPTRKVRGSAGLTLTVYSPPRQELHLTRAFRRVGPVVAIGQPGEYLPDLGAHRLYVDDAWWKSEILRLVQSARVVIIRIGPTLGTYWEFLNVFRCVPRDRIILYLEPRGTLLPALQPYLPQEACYTTHSPARFLWFPQEGGTRISNDPLEVIVSKGLGKRRLSDIFFPIPCETPGEQYIRDLGCNILVFVVALIVYSLILYLT
jgi:hypothetical protein